MDTNAYVAFLVVGVLLVAIDGQFIYHSGKRYLRNTQGNPEAGASMTRLVTVLFHLVVLGALALLSTIGFPGGSSLPSVVGRIGVMLLVLALAHAITLGVLARVREEQVVEEMHTRGRGVDPRAQAPIDRQLSEPVVSPVPGQEGRNPQVSPSVEQGGPYSTGGNLV
ncbi:hypothetical protein FPZ12_013535 [Amycolatopsis acidicola]|uniref:Uncharacterized protein n=1 Tax=Amycolatopsis acidicola TaxID=2596893 RepID=A0A5N0V770_9PSEU|nr:hypothetical protein [Amycolatopsis acidicola]KAA9161875.1 hypothetical protein FPZ12_013535 [Amycolatopsis acidicola]